ADKQLVEDYIKHGYRDAEAGSKFYLPELDYRAQFEEVQMYYNAEISDYPIYTTGYTFDREENCVVMSERKVRGDNYYVFSYVQSPLDYSQNDLFVQADRIMNALYNFRYLIAVVAFVSATLCMVLFCWIIIRILSGFVGTVNGHFGMIFRACVIFGAVSVLELVIYHGSSPYSEGLYFYWIIKTIVLGLVTIAMAVHFDRVKKAAENMAKGELNSKIDTSKMFFDFKKMAEYLNDIDDGIGKAVDERIKSEHLRTELITNVSHDIKTPLTSIVSYVDLLKKEGPESENAAEYLDVLSRQSEKLKKLIEDLIEASKASTGNLSVDLTKCELTVALTQVIGEYEERLREKNIELHVNTPEPPVEIMADVNHLQRVIDNLMVNIYKYAQPGTRAYVDLVKKGNRAEMIFKNTSAVGLNVPAEELLERFSRGDSARGGEGHGLGLSIAQSLTDLMGGKLDLTVDGDFFKVSVEFTVAE
ncbi:MAG: HAMP domain-containing histidine kinase, partial [Lachnospiraceae bacterium]|nr:HAMP domain-containing histidine kinase [Lachnospiraceae bacterium]